MASKRNSIMTMAQYKELRRGYFEAQGYEIDNATEEQDQEMSNLMEADGIFEPKQSLALPGAINGNIPTAGNSGILAENEAVKPSTTKKGTGATPKKGASVAARSSDIERLFVQAASEGDRAGNFAGDVFAVTYSNALNNRITELVADGLEATPERDLDSFLQRHGY